MSKPISLKEVVHIIPDFVFDAVNALIRKKKMEWQKCYN